MIRRTLIALAAVLTLAALPAAAQKSMNANPINGNVKFSRFAPGVMGCSEYPHGGAGRVCHMEMTPGELMQSQFLFVHRGMVYPKSSLGEHVHRRMEEMYFILDDKTAYFTVNGHTAELPGPAMALCPMGDSHGIFNPWDEPIQLLNIGIALADRRYDAVDFNKQNDLADRLPESPPPFMWSVLDRRLCMQHPIENFLGGSGTIYSREVWNTPDFQTNVFSIKHMIIPAGSVIGYHRHDDLEEVYYILSGQGRLTIDDVTLDVRKDDCGTCVLHGAHGFWNNSDEDVEILAIAVAMVKGVSAPAPLNVNLKSR